jgi:hypothetical protein
MICNLDRPTELTMRANYFPELYVPSGQCEITRTRLKTGRWRQFALLLNGGGLWGPGMQTHRTISQYGTAPITVHDSRLVRGRNR